MLFYTCFPTPLEIRRPTPGYALRHTVNVGGSGE